MNECIAKQHRMYGGMQNGSYSEKEKSRENKSKDTMVKTEGSKLSGSV